MPEGRLLCTDELVIAVLAERGVELTEVADIVHALQSKHCPDLTPAECLAGVRGVLQKREVQQAILTGVTLDVLAEKGLLPEPLLTVVADDDPLFGVDEILALSIINVYGSIGLTNFGYLDHEKPGVLGRLHGRGKGERGRRAPPDGCRGEPWQVHTFLDDLIAGVAAAAAAKLAHARGPRQS
ncbi:MAG TPA: phosphatidylglycerophosphatase A [Bacillota bacterium]